MQAFQASRRYSIRSVRLLVGLFLYGIAISLMLKANIGASPWDVFGQGFAVTTGVSFGLSTIIISAVVLLLWIPLRQMPGIGTIANAILVGLFADLGLAVIPSPNQLVLRVALFFGGLLLLAFATALYIGAGMGPGARDGLMTGLVRVSKRPVWMVRTAIEIVVVVLGFLLGGTVGLGTIIFVFSIGPLTQLTLRWLRVDITNRLKANPAPKEPATPLTS